MSLGFPLLPSYIYPQQNRETPRTFVSANGYDRGAALKDATISTIVSAIIVATPTALHTLRNHLPEICDDVKFWLQEEAGRMTELEWLVAMAACPNVMLRITTRDPNQSPPLVFGAEAFTRGATKDGLVENAYCQKAQQLATSPMRRWINAGMPITRLMFTTRQSG